MTSAGTSIRSGESGFTLIEMLVAMIVLSVGVIATIGVFSSSKNVSLIAQRHEVAVHQAQREMEWLRGFAYKDLGLTSAPAVSDRLQSDSDTIGWFNGVNTTDGSLFTVRTAVGATPALREHFVLSDSNADGDVPSAPRTFTVGAAAISGKVYRYVTWRPENCGTDGAGQALCPGDRDTKRLVVAVTIDPSNNRPGPSRPVWISSVAIDASSEPYEQ